MNGVVMLVAVLVTLVALKQIIDWMGLLLTVVALLLVFGTGVRRG